MERIRVLLIIEDNPADARLIQGMPANVKSVDWALNWKQTLSGDRRDGNRF
jgi:hypothetical protein